MPAPTAEPARRRGGRPTRAEAASIDQRVRECALRLFLEHGYEGTSMDAIAKEAGTTKVSLYARYPGKEQLFLAVLQWATQRPDWPGPEPEVPAGASLEKALTVVAGAALRRALDPLMVQLGRIAVAQAGRFPELAARHETSFWMRRQVVSDLLRRHAATGEIVADDPDVLAEHFLGMVAGMPARLASYGIVRTPRAQKRYTDAAVRLFVRGLRA